MCFVFDGAIWLAGLAGEFGRVFKEREAYRVKIFRPFWNNKKIILTCNEKIEYGFILKNDLFV